MFLRIRFFVVAAFISTSALGAPQPGVTLYGIVTSNDVQLIDLNGNVVHTWTSAYVPGMSVHLSSNGSILRPGKDETLPGPTGGGLGGRIQRIAWDGTVEWEAVVADGVRRQHHDIVELPNGDILALVYDQVSAADAIAAGRDPALVGTEFNSEGLQQIDGQTGAVVWEWYAFDHLIQDFDPLLPNYGNPADFPERFDINYKAGLATNWLHCNAMSYNADLDQIVISSRSWSEFWVISHDPGDSGDLLYRWGNSEAYGRGTALDQQLFGQHSVHWIDKGLQGAGNFLLFNNTSGGTSSSVCEIIAPLNPDGTYELTPGNPYGPAAATWVCDNAGGNSFFSSITSSAQRLANGNTLIGVGRFGDMYEVNTTCGLEWSFSDPGGGKLFRAERFSECDPRLLGLLGCNVPIPAVSSWGVAIMVLVLLLSASIMLRSSGKFARGR